jgi:hypothetical protein
MTTLAPSKEKRTFPWDTMLTMAVNMPEMVVKGTDIEVKWCPITKMYWEV